MKTLIVASLLALATAALAVPAADAKCFGTSHVGACETTNLPGQADACVYVQGDEAETSACVVEDLYTCGGGVDATVGEKVIPLFHFPCPGPVIA